MSGDHWNDWRADLAGIALVLFMVLITLMVGCSPAPTSPKTVVTVYPPAIGLDVHESRTLFAAPANVRWYSDHKLVGVTGAGTVLAWGYTHGRESALDTAHVCAVSIEEPTQSACALVTVFAPRAIR